MKKDDEPGREDTPNTIMKDNNISSSHDIKKDENEAPAPNKEESEELEEKEMDVNVSEEFT